MLKTITTPSVSQFDTLIAKARSEAKKVKLSKKAIGTIIKEARKRK